MKRFIDREELISRGLPGIALETTIVGHGRFTVTKEIIFEMDGKHWRAEYSEGATEMQWEEPWEFEREVEIAEVEQREVLVKQWVLVNQ